MVRSEKNLPSIQASRYDGPLFVSAPRIAITVGRILDYLSVNEKVKNGMEFKNYLDQAIRLNNTDYLLYYLRGRWTFKICNLSWAEKAGIRMFGPVPNVSMEDAFEDFLKVTTTIQLIHRG